MEFFRGALFQGEIKRPWGTCGGRCQTRGGRQPWHQWGRWSPQRKEAKLQGMCWQWCRCLGWWSAQAYCEETNRSDPSWQSMCPWTHTLVLHRSVHTSKQWQQQQPTFISYRKLHLVLCKETRRRCCPEYALYNNASMIPICTKKEEFSLGHQ